MVGFVVVVTVSVLSVHQGRSVEGYVGSPFRASELSYSLISDAMGADWSWKTSVIRTYFDMPFWPPDSSMKTLSSSKRTQDKRNAGR